MIKEVGSLTTSIIKIDTKDFDPCDYKNQKEIKFKGILVDNTLYLFPWNVLHKEYLSTNTTLNAKKAKGIRIVIYNFSTKFKIDLFESYINPVEANNYAAIEKLIKKQFFSKPSQSPKEQNMVIARILKLVKKIHQYIKPA